MRFVGGNRSFQIGAQEALGWKRSFRDIDGQYRHPSLTVIAVHCGTMVRGGSRRSGGAPLAKDPARYKVLDPATGRHSSRSSQRARAEARL